MAGLRRFLLPGLVFAIVALASLAAAAVLWRQAAERDMERLQAAALLAERAVADKIVTHTTLLRGAAGLFGASEDVTRGEFETYVERLGIGTRYPGILGVGYTERATSEAERDAMVARMRAQGFPDFRVWPAAQRDVWHSILFLWPLDERNQAAIGYDMFTEPTRRAAMQRARDTGRSVASGRVLLVQEIEPEKQPGFLIYTPVYAGGIMPDTIAERRLRLIGFAYSPLRAHDLFETVFPKHEDRQIDIAVHAGAPIAETLLFSTSPDIATAARRIERPIEVAGQRWTLAIATTAAFRADSNRSDAWWVAGLGLLVALLLAVATGATERARLALRKANATLEQRVRERTSELTDQMARREKAEEQMRQMQKMEAVGQLTGGIAHDFNNMLAIVIGSLDMAKRRIGQPERLATLIDNALEGANRAATLTQRLLAFSRLQPLSPEPLDANHLVAEMSDLLRRTLGEQVELIEKLEERLWATHVDASQLEAAILNLAVNARDAMPRGGTLTIETCNCSLDDSYASRHAQAVTGDFVLIAVSDTGIGMDAETKARAFDPFFTTKEVGKGTGLGLSQVFGFVRQSGGHLDIVSAPGEGTTVEIYLPRYTGAEKPAGERRASPAPSPTGRPDEIVLVVEDEDRVRMMSVAALRDLGYTVVHASDGKEALGVLDTHPGVKLLFTDVVMPGMNGRELADEATRRAPGLKLLFTTGYTRDAVVHEGVLDPGVEMLPKPFTLDQLAERVRSVLDA